MELIKNRSLISNRMQAAFTSACFVVFTHPNLIIKGEFNVR